MTVLPAAGFVSRLGVYLGEMFPLPRHVAAAWLTALGFLTILARIHGESPAPLSPALGLGSASVFLVMLILRLMDELKDTEVDGALFSHRPLPSGRVREGDIVFALGSATALFLLAHAASGLAFASAATVLGYAFLMFRWFFVPVLMRARLLIALVTHTPIIPLLLLHLVALFAVEHRLSLDRILWAPTLRAVGLYWAVLFAWEISRKIRSRGEENAYVTYSRLLGPKGAVLVAVSAQTLALAAGIALFRAHGLSPTFAAFLLAGYGVALGGHLRFLLGPGPATSRLRGFAEANVFGVLLACALA